MRIRRRSSLGIKDTTVAVLLKEGRERSFRWWGKKEQVEDTGRMGRFRGIREGRELSLRVGMGKAVGRGRLGGRGKSWRRDFRRTEEVEQDMVEKRLVTTEMGEGERG